MPPPHILSVPPPLRYITFGTSWSSANALQISHFHTAYVQSRSANKHCNTACVQSRSANNHCNTAYMQSRSANKHCNTAYMQSRSANSHGHIIYDKWTSKGILFRNTPFLIAVYIICGKIGKVVHCVVWSETGRQDRKNIKNILVFVWGAWANI